LAVCGRRKAAAERSPELTTWATRLVTPGDEVEDGDVKSLYNSVTESATENKPPTERSTVAVAQGNLGDARMHATLGKGEKVG